MRYFQISEKRRKGDNIYIIQIKLLLAKKLPQRKQHLNFKDRTNRDISPTIHMRRTMSLKHLYEVWRLHLEMVVGFSLPPPPRNILVFFLKSRTQRGADLSTRKQSHFAICRENPSPIWWGHVLYSRFKISKEGLRNLFLNLEIHSHMHIKHLRIRQKLSLQIFKYKHKTVFKVS